VIDATPLEFVVALPEAGVKLPQPVPFAKLTTSPATAAPLEFLTVALTVDVLVPSAGRLEGLAEPVMVLPVPLVWVMVAVPLPPVPAGVPVPLSVAVMVQKPLVVLEMYATATWPLELVTPVVGLKVPHAPPTVLVVKATVSPDTATPLGLVTVSVIVEVLVPLAEIDEGFATTAFVLGTAVCASLPEPVAAVAASCTLIVQAPTVVPAV
jgi:hypothetical protein